MPTFFESSSDNEGAVHVLGIPTSRQKDVVDHKMSVLALDPQHEVDEDDNSEDDEYVHEAM